MPKPKNRLSLSRREFLKTAAFLGGSALAISKIGSAFAIAKRLEAAESAPNYPLNEPENIIYSVCLQCHTSCAIKCKILDGVLVKIDGNSYSPQTMLPHIPYGTSPRIASKVDGKLCPKGQAGIQTLYDPYRLRKVLKRAGPRGSNRWIAVDFEKAVEEIVNGGKLFASVPGEENREVPGLRDIYKLRDPEISKALSESVSQLAEGKMTMEDFKEKHRDHLQFLIDADHPDLGPVNNQLIFMAGRIQHGRIEFSKRWLHGGFGSVNWFEHTTICEQSHHIAYKLMTDQYIDGKWDKGKTHMKPDILRSEFVIFFGTGAFEANFGPTHLAEKVTKAIVEGKLRIAVVDPRMSKTAAHAWKWVPVKPGSDSALAWGMIRWILENKRYDSRYLSCANKAAAEAAGEPTWTNGTYLVKLDENGRATELLRAKELGLGSEHEFVTMVGGSPRKVNPYDESNPVYGDIFWEGEIRGIRAKTAMSLVREQAFTRTVSEWAQECGLKDKDVITLAGELTSHGKKAAVEFYRGAVQHTDGYYTAQALIILNLLIGNPDHAGGLSVGGGHWHEMGDARGGPYNLAQGLHPGKLTSFGVPITREKVAYEKTTLYRKYGYPAKRPWYPLSANVYQEILPSARTGYPYPIKALILHKGTPGFSVPGANSQIASLRDTQVIPLLIACDIVIGESSMYADYIFPDLSIWERWGAPHPSPDINTKCSQFRQPAVAPIPETVRVFGQEMPMSMEALMLAVAEKLGMPGYGPDGFAPGLPFEKPEDFYLKMAANIAAGDKEGEELPPASKEEIDLFHTARSHLPKSVFDPERWSRAAGHDWWPRVIYLLNRGGRYEDFARYEKSGPHMPKKFGAMFNIFVEKTAKTRNSFTGDYFSGMGVYRSGPISARGKPISANGEYPLHLITFKEISGGQSRTPGNYWLLGVLSENGVLVNPRTASELGLKDGQRVRLKSPTNPEGVWDLGHEKLPIVGKLMAVEWIRPGVVGVSWHFGHWAYGARETVVDGKRVKGDSRRGKGLCPNALMLIDPDLGDVCLTDPIGASASFYDTPVKIEPA